MIALSPVSGYTQNPGLSIGPRSRAFSIIHGYHPQSSAYFDAMASAGGAPEIGKLIAHDLFIRQLANAGLLARLGYVYPWLGGTEATNRINAGSAGPASGLGTFAGTVTHSAGGIQSDGATGYFNTTISPAAAMTLTYGAIIAYKGGSEADGTTRYFIGASQDGASQNTSSLGHGSSGALIVGAVAGSTTTGVLASDESGLHMVTTQGGRMARLYSNGALVRTVEEVGTLPTIPIFILARNLAGAATAFSTVQNRLASFGGGYTEAEVPTLKAIIEQYMGNLGRTAA